MSEDIKVGDWVRWERRGRDDLWAEGEVLSLTSDMGGLGIRICRACPRFDHMTGDGGHPFDGPKWRSVSLRRIPRPGQDDVLREESDGSLSFRGVKITQPVDPLDVMCDGVTLRDLLDLRQCVDRERDVGAGTSVSIPWRNADPWTWTPAQRAAVSAHWSAELRRKVSEAKERERCVVSYSEWEPGE